MNRQPKPGKGLTLMALGMVALKGEVMKHAFRRVHVRRSRARLRRAAAVGSGLLVFLGLTVSVGPAYSASVINVTTTSPDGSGGCSLSEAIIAANTDSNAHASECTAGSGADTIMLPVGGTFVMSAPYDDYANYTGPTATPMVTSAITIEARGATIQHGGSLVPYRAFAVGVTGNLTIREAYVKGFEVQGGDGSSGGGGGMGAGGAVYVRGGSLTVEQSTFESNGALGGDGGAAQVVDCFGPDSAIGGGGGGLGGDGGDEFNGCSSGGGGGGSRGDGASGSNSGTDFGGGGAGGTVDDGSGTNGGAQCGGDGGSTFLLPDGDDGCDGGGGGGGGFHASSATVATGDGGTGGYGGGGGGGSGSLFNQGSGGRGGFGGGGGAGSKLFIADVLVEGEVGGDGGFGGGGGAGECAVLPFCAGAGGTFAGDGASLHGGGGAGLGGAIFGHAATITIRNSTFANNYAIRGRSGGGGANDGRGAGGAIFLVGGSLTVVHATVSGNSTGETNASGQGIGGGGIVVYEPTDGTATSFTLRNTIIAGNGIHECYVRNTPSVVAGIGNLIVNGSAPSVSDQTHSACPGTAVTDDPGLAALALNFPGRTPTMAIAVDSSAANNADAATALPIDQRGVPRPPAAPDIGAYEFASPPTTTIALTPASPDGSNDWYKSVVGVSITAVDDGTVAQTRCVLDPTIPPASFSDLPDATCALTSVGADGQHAIYAASVDADGYVEIPPVSATFKVDRTAPSLAPALSGPALLGAIGVTALPNATDTTSGVASSSCSTVDTSTPGVKTLTCTAADNAGNTATATLTYVVEYNIVGFFDPVPGSKWKVGQTVPVKVALGNASGARISDAEGVALAAACRVRFSVTGAQTKAADCMKYDSVADQFIYTWKLAKTGTGAATIIVSITYPGSSTITQRTLSITITN